MITKYSKLKKNILLFKKVVNRLFKKIKKKDHKTDTLEVILNDFFFAARK